MEKGDEVIVSSRLMRSYLGALSQKLREVADLMEDIGKAVGNEPRSNGGHLLPSAKELRKAAGLTGAQVAAKIGAHKVTVSVMETGRASRRMLEQFGAKYAEAIGVPWGTFEFRRDL